MDHFPLIREKKTPRTYEDKYGWLFAGPIEFNGFDPEIKSGRGIAIPPPYERHETRMEDSRLVFYRDPIESLKEWSAGIVACRLRCGGPYRLYAGGSIAKERHLEWMVESGPVLHRWAVWMVRWKQAQIKQPKRFDEYSAAISIKERGIERGVSRNDRAGYWKEAGTGLGPAEPLKSLGCYWPRDCALNVYWSIYDGQNRAGKGRFHVEARAELERLLTEAHNDPISGSWRGDRMKLDGATELYREAENETTGG